MKLSKSVFCLIFTMLLAGPSLAEPDLYEKRVVAKIDLTKQRMYVIVEGELEHTWKISSGRSGYLTPTGTYTPKFLHRMHYSRKYDNAPMPHSVFYYRGYAVHGTTYERRLGRPASHGCIRLSRKNAKTFFYLVKNNGRYQTEIALTGRAPGATKYVKKRKKNKRRYRTASERRYYAWLKRKRAWKLRRKKRYSRHRAGRDPFSFLFR
ncbi:MAG: L,D-transpeptidase [Hyphomicrobiales bacterium]